MRGNILATTGFEEFLFTVCNFQEAPFYQLADIACRKPAIYKGGFCSLRLFIITDHYIISLAENLSIIGNLNLHIINDRTDGTGTAILFFVMIYCNYRRGFGQTITFHNGNISGGKDLRQPGLAWCSAHYDGFYIAPQCGAPFAENKLIGNRQFKFIPPAAGLPRLVLLTQIYCPEEQLFFNAGQLMTRGHNFLIHLFQ
ncbi:hypothetical protein D9M68_732180 [compost metagenome]